MSTPTYNRIIRKMVVGFGNLFKDITLVRYNPDLSEAQRTLVPIVYANKEMYVRRLQDDPNLDKKVSIVLPRMSFEMSGITGLQSGDAMYGTANSGNLGAIRSKAVESSNVDLTSELVKLMTLQRQYTANSQAVKVEAATIVDDAIRIGQ